MRLPLLFPQNSLRDFCGNPENKKAFARPLHREGYNREKSCAEAALSNFLFQMLLPDAPEGVEVSRKSFSMKNLSARNGLLHRIRDTAANLHLVLIAISASMRVCPAGTNRGPQRRETLLAEIIRKNARLLPDAPEGVALFGSRCDAVNALAVDARPPAAADDAAVRDAVHL